MVKEVHILCDYDALYAAIELKLSGLPQIQVLRFEPDAVKTPLGNATNHRGTHEADLIIVAPVPPRNDPMTMLARASLLNLVGQVPVLVVSEQPSCPESDDKITYLNFPFDMDDLTETVAGILGEYLSERR